MAQRWMARQVRCASQPSANAKLVHFMRQRLKDVVYTEPHPYYEVQRAQFIGLDGCR